MWVINTVDSSLFAYDIDSLPMSGGSLPVAPLLSTQIIDYTEQPVIEYWNGIATLDQIPETVTIPQSVLTLVESITAVSAFIFPNSDYVPLRLHPDRLPSTDTLMDVNPWFRSSNVMGPTGYFTTPYIQSSDRQNFPSWDAIEISSGPMTAEITEALFSRSYQTIVNLVEYQPDSYGQDPRPIAAQIAAWTVSRHAVQGMSLTYTSYQDEDHPYSLTGQGPYPEGWYTANGEIIQSIPSLSLYYIPESAIVSGIPVTQFSGAYINLFPELVPIDTIACSHIRHNYDYFGNPASPPYRRDEWLGFESLASGTIDEFRYHDPSINDFKTITEVSDIIPNYIYFGFGDPSILGRNIDQGSWGYHNKRLSIEKNSSVPTFTAMKTYYGSYGDEFRFDDFYNDEGDFRVGGLSTTVMTSSLVSPDHWYYGRLINPLDGYVLTSHDPALTGIEILNVTEQTIPMLVSVTASSEEEKQYYDNLSQTEIIWTPHYTTQLLPIHALWARGDWTGQRWSYLNNIEKDRNSYWNVFSVFR